MSRFTLAIPNEPEQTFATRAAALRYIRKRQKEQTLTDRATITDGKTGTVMTVPGRYYSED